MKIINIALTALLTSLILLSCKQNNKSSNIVRINPELDSIFDICRKAESLPLDSIAKYTQLAYTLSQANGTDLDKIQGGFFRFGYFFASSQHDSALYICSKIEQLPKAENDTDFVRNKIFTLKTGLLHRIGKSEEALDWAFKILPDLEASNNYANLRRLYINIGVINIELNRLDESIRWNKKILDNPKFQASNEIMVAANNTSDAYVSLNELDSASKYANIALKMAEERKHLLVNANALNNLGKIYTSQKNYAKAKEAVQQSMEIRQTIGDPYFIVADLVQLADINFRMGEYETSKSLALKAIEIARENKIETQEYFLNNSLFNSHYGLKDYKAASDYGKKIIDYLYEENNKGSAKAFAELEVKYETAKKEQQIQAQKYIIEKKNNTIIASVLGIVLLCLIALITFQYLRQKQKHKLQAVIIKEQDEAARAVIAAEEHERSRMSQNLHDGVGQLLSGLKMNLQALRERVPMGANETIFNKSLDLLDDAVQETRSISHQILPNNIVRMGLGNALQSLIDKIDQDKIKINLSVTGLHQEILPETQLMIYRILQEGIQNAIKHAQAQKIEITIDVSVHDIIGTISDDGLGFDTTHLEKLKGVGLNNIATRVRFLKGKYDIKSQKDLGTTLSFEIPLI